MDEKTFLIIFVVIGWATSIVFEIQCQSWKRKHGEAITAWIIESNNKDKQIYKLQEELENLKAKPVKHGRWIWDSNAPHREHGAYKCSNCGCHSDFEENYCYNCGARLDGDEE